MSQNFLSKSSFHAHLIKIDLELANICAEKGCDYCGGKLHQANYPRSPMGIPSKFRDQYSRRISLCCVNCRKRTTPPSVRFFGRRWYPAPLHIFISIMTCGINKRRIALIEKYFGITVRESTWRRWRTWFSSEFVITKFWSHEKGRFAPTTAVTQGSFPRTIFNLYKGNIEQKMLLFLRFLSPITIGIIHAI